MADSASAPQEELPALSLATTWQGCAATLFLAGELDLATAPRLRQAIDDLFTQQPESVVVDLTDLRFMSSTGIAALVWAYSRAAAGAARFALVASSRATLRPLQLTGVTTQVSVYPTLTDAVRAVSGE